MGWRRLLGTVVGLLALALGVLVAPAQPAFASSPLCTTRYPVFTPSGYILQMPVTASHSYDCYLTQGIANDAVRALQSGLNCMGNNLSVDGIYGPATRAAVLTVQRTHSIAQDGVYGAQTRGVMRFRDNSIPSVCIAFGYNAYPG